MSNSADLASRVVFHHGQIIADEMCTLRLVPKRIFDLLPQSSGGVRHAVVPSVTVLLLIEGPVRVEPGWKIRPSGGKPGQGIDLWHGRGQNISEKTIWRVLAPAKRGFDLPIDYLRPCVQLPTSTIVTEASPIYLRRISPIT